MKKFMLVLVFGVVFAMSAAAASAMEDHPYTEGPVTEVEFIKTKPGKFDDYMTWLSTVWRQINEEAKKAGIVISYRIYTTEPRTPSDPNLILEVTYPNMAALDGLEDKMDAIDEKIEGTLAKSNQNEIDRGSLRDVIGSTLKRELLLK
jgi:hypothetical protein